MGGRELHRSLLRVTLIAAIAATLLLPAVDALHGSPEAHDLTDPVDETTQPITSYAWTASTSSASGPSCPDPPCTEELLWSSVAAGDAAYDGFYQATLETHCPGETHGITVHHPGWKDDDKRMIVHCEGIKAPFKQVGDLLDAPPPGGAFDPTDLDRVASTFDGTRPAGVADRIDPVDDAPRETVNVSVSGSADRTATHDDPGRPIAPIVTLLTGLSAAALLLYRRLTKQDLLEHDLRSRMLDLVRDQPAIHASELARRFDVAVTTILYHGRMLAENDLIVMRRDAGEVVFLDRSTAETRVEEEVLCTLRSESKRRVLEAVLDAPGSSMSEIARRIERARNTVKHHVDDLVDRGLLEDRDPGRTTSFEVPTDVRPTLIRRL